MCGIWAFFQKKQLYSKYESILYNYFSALKPRGPDRSIYCDLSEPVNIKFGFHRLAIMDTSIKGDQPFKYESMGRTIYVICNGEIYNHQELCKYHKFEPKSGSDCEVIALLYEYYDNGNIDFISRELEGEYAFMILDIDNNTGDYNIYICNDRFGIRPLFVLEDEYGIMFSSELKGFQLCNIKQNNVKRFPPRNYAILNKTKGILGKLNYVEYYNLNDIEQKEFKFQDEKDQVIRSFERAVTLMLNTDREMGCLLSGGLDSSLVSSIASKILKKRGKKLNTFSIGLPDSEDEYFAKLVSKYIESDHTHITVSEKDFLDTVPNVIHMIESYDITTVRASTAQYLISKWISENTNIKVLLCGDGSDELSSGYLYFHKAPSAQESHEENIRLLNDIHLYDGLRADRCIAGHGIEARFPFLNHKFVETYLSIDPKLRVPVNGLEKWFLRMCFEKGDYLPEQILMRKKTAFSDGCSNAKRSWYQILQDNIETLYTNEQLKEAQKIFPHVPPHTKEALYFRELFCEYFGYGSVCKIYSYYWLPKWCGNITDPSARTLNFNIE